MPIVQTDWTIDRATGNIRYIGDDHPGASPSYATVIEFHRFLQDLADDAVSVGDDELDITNTDPSSRSTDNIITLLGTYNIDDTASEHLYDGSITQSSGDTIYDGIVNFGNADVQIQLIQNGAVIADDWWNFSGGGLNPDSAAGISHRFMVKVRDAGSDIDGRRLIGVTREYGFSFSEFPINGTSRGNNVLALSNSADLNNQTAEGTVAALTISNTTEGYNGIDIDNNGADEFYYSEWNLDGNSINDFYEYAKYLTRDGSAETLYGLSGELFRGITHEINIDGPTGTFNAFEPVSWTGGTGQMLAIDSPTAGTQMWIQLLTGVAPTDNLTITGGTSGATADVNITVVERSVSEVFVGQSTGSAIIGAYGLGIETDDVTASDTLFDLTNTAVNPPNNVTFSVGGLVTGEDYVIVAPYDGVTSDINGDPAFDKDQLSLQTTLTTANITSVQVSTTIPSDTPAAGTIRVADDTGLERRLVYTSFTGDTFTVDPTASELVVANVADFDTNNATAGNNVYITYLDEVSATSTETFTVVYSSDRDLVVLVRDGGGTPIKQFITSAVLSSGGGSVTAIRTSDL
jgi:hypothetical protein